MAIARTDFAWDGYFWKAQLDLRGPGVEGPIEVVVSPEGRGEEPLSDGELAQVQWLADNWASVLDAVHAAVVEAYPAIKDSFEDCWDPEDYVMPDVGSVEDLLTLVDLVGVSVHALFVGDVPYLGFEFDCEWDEEHGLGVLTHGHRVAEVGGAADAFMLWVAEHDARAHGFKVPDR